MLTCMLCILSHHVLFFHIFYFHLTYVYSVWSFTVPCLLHETKAQYSIRTGKYSVRMRFVSGFLRSLKPKIRVIFHRNKLIFYFHTENGMR